MANRSQRALHYTLAQKKLQNDGNKSRDCVVNFENASEIEIFLLLNCLHVGTNKNCSREYMHEHYEAITHGPWQVQKHLQNNFFRLHF